MLPQLTDQQYKIVDVLITSDYLDTPVEITAQISELLLYESIHKPYITGQLALLDDGDIFSQIRFRGTERLSFTIVSDDPGLTDIKYQHTMVMRSVVKRETITDKSAAVVVALIDEHAFIDQALRISKSYTASIEDIIISLANGELGIAVDRSYTKYNSLQGAIRYISPYLTPINIMRLLLDRATTSNGSPFFLYSSLFDRQGALDVKNLRLGDFDTMYTQRPFNANRPYVYSAAMPNTSDANEIFTIEHVSFDHLDDTLKMVADGATGCLFTSQDVFRNTKLAQRQDITKTLQRLSDNLIIPEQTTQTMYDDLYTFNRRNTNSSLHEVNTQYFHTLASQGTYGPWRSYHEGAYAYDSQLRARSIAIQSMLQRNVIKVGFSGVALFLNGVSVGDTMAIDFFETDNAEVETVTADPQLSGSYLIVNMRHQFKDTKHDVVAEVTKINTRPPQY